MHAWVGLWPALQPGSTAPRTGCTEAGAQRPCLEEGLSLPQASFSLPGQGCCHWLPVQSHFSSCPDGNGQKSPSPPLQSQQQDGGTAQSCPHPPLPGLQPFTQQGSLQQTCLQQCQLPVPPRQNHMPSGGQQTSRAQEQRGDSVALL